MTQRDLEKLLQDPSLRREVEQGLFNDPKIWLSEEEQSLGESEQAVLKQRRKAELRGRVMERAQEESEIPRRKSRRMPRVPRSVSIAAACVAALLLFFAVVPTGTTTAANFFAKIARKVTGYVVIESEGEAPPNVVKPDETKISGVDGFTFVQYQTLAALMEKTGLDPVVLTAGYADIVDIAYEEQEGEYREIVIAYELADDVYITTTQHWEKGVHAQKPKKSEKREILGGVIAYAGYEDDYQVAAADIESSRFGVTAPKGVDFDAVLNGLAYGSAVDAAAFAVKPPEYSPSTLEPECYNSLTEFSKQNGIWPVALKDGFAAVTDVEYYVSRVAGNTVCAAYDAEGGWVCINQKFGYTDGMVTTMNDETYFETTILDGVTIHCSVDAVDGSTAGVAALPDSVLMVIAQKGVNFDAVLENLVATAPEGKH